MTKFSMGLDFGSNSVRALIISLSDGKEFGSGVCTYPGGDSGVFTDKANHHLARQSPLAYVEAMEKAIVTAVKEASAKSDFDIGAVVGIGVDTTGSTPLPVTMDCVPLAALDQFKDNLNAYAWMWKDHTSVEEAAEITKIAAEHRPLYLKRCGGTYSSEWFFSKVWHCLNIDPEVFNTAYTWIEFADYIPAVLAGINDVSEIKPSVCAAGHKAMYSEEWGGLPDAEFLAMLDPKIAELRDRMYDKAYASDVTAGNLCSIWAEKTGLPEGIPVSVGAFDAHMGAVGAGVGGSRLVKIIGTSTCDLMVTPNNSHVPEITGICGVVDGSVIPGYYGIEAGQSAVGDIFNWFVSKICKTDHSVFKELTAEASALKPGESGLLALDWNNGNRCTLVDPMLTGLMVGMTLHTSRAEMYRALIEGTAFGAKRIIDRLEETGVTISEVINCGGIAEKDAMFMQIYADVLDCRMVISGSAQTCALGAAIFGAIVAGEYDSVAAAQENIVSFKDKVFDPIPENVDAYRNIYDLYCELYDSFGIKGELYDHSRIMKELLKISASAKK